MGGCLEEHRSFLVGNCCCLANPALREGVLAYLRLPRCCHRPSMALRGERPFHFRFPACLFQLQFLVPQFLFQVPSFQLPLHQLPLHQLPLHWQLPRRLDYQPHPLQPRPRRPLRRH